MLAPRSVAEARLHLLPGGNVQGAPRLYSGRAMQVQDGIFRSALCPSAAFSPPPLSLRALNIPEAITTASFLCLKSPYWDLGLAASIYRSGLSLLTWAQGKACYPLLS